MLQSTVKYNVYADNQKLDKNFFRKQYNDRFGHISEDQCLRTFAGFLKKEVQNRSGSLIRYGGEEFLIFLFGQDAEAAEEIAEHMRRSAESGGYISDGPDSSPVTVSIGVYK
ncbi:GGDEF domain-containing protein [Anaerostipes caccae]|uniref:GGDEF domain-containing protein n=2 Tax=Lachnospiraceae TaxID=186803 RepID=UPI000E4A66B5|nr:MULTISPECIES: diguanylate cyclase [Anaerostipes]RGH23949.1 diguanylate cyclase [Anaerostipes sp. AF04-45]